MTSKNTMNNALCLRSLHSSFKMACVLVTLVMITYFLYKYDLDEDLCVIKYKKFYDTELDVFPTLSLCFTRIFKEGILLRKGLNTSHYKQFLSGHGTVDDIVKNINYDDVTLDVHDYIIRYFVHWKNGSRNVYPKNDFVGWKSPYVSYNGFWLDRFVKCFAIETTSPDMFSFNVELNQTIFAGGIRPVKGKFLVLFHYPNQILRSLSTLKEQWVSQTSNQSYAMDFWLQHVEVLIRRNKAREHCIEDWKNYDNIVTEKHIKSVGCRAPYHSYLTSDVHHLPLCHNKGQMKNIKLPLTGDKIHMYEPPCRSIERVSYEYNEHD